MRRTRRPAIERASLRGLLRCEATADFVLLERTTRA
jgi:hypothetical protein